MNKLLIGCLLGACALAQEIQDSSVQPAPLLPPAVVTIPAGTRVLMKLNSPLHTTSATEGSGLYLTTTYPVVIDNRVAIPVHSCVQGFVAKDHRAGRVKGRAQFRFQFQQIILPDNRALAVTASLQSLPGNSRVRTRDSKHAIEPVDQIDRDVYTVAKGVGGGGVLGALLGRTTAPNIGYGVAAGGGLALAKVLFTRGDEISLPSGTSVEMVLDRPLTVEVR